MCYLCDNLSNQVCYKMETQIEKIMLKAAKAYLESLDDEQFLALTCELSNLHNGIIRLVHTQSLIRQFRAPMRVTADIFQCTKRNIRHFL